MKKEDIINKWIKRKVILNQTSGTIGVMCEGLVGEFLEDIKSQD